MSELPEIVVRENGAYVAKNVTVRRKEIVLDEQGNALTYVTADPLETRDTVVLCRCGQSSNKPFCDNTHAKIDWDGSCAPHDVSYAERANPLGGEGLTIHDDRATCSHSAFCGNIASNVWDMAGETADSDVRAQVMNMVEKCPSGALTYTFDGADSPNEPGLPVEIGVLNDGPLFVQGGIAVTLPDGTTLETRNRVALCRCGASANKPLCDGSHHGANFSDPG
jgi:CDGSH-type Zn-finger protein/ferredoxin